MSARAAFAIETDVVWLFLSLVACDVDKGRDVNASPGSLPLQTVCLGRYFVDIPAEIRLRGDVELYFGLDKSFRTVKAEVLRTDGGIAAFDAAVATQLAKLTSSFDADTPSKNMLANQQSLDKDTVLLLEHLEPTMSGYYRVLVISRIGNAVALFESDVFKQDKPEEIESRVLAVARQTRYAADLQHEGKGTCIGPLIIDAGQDGERFSIGARGTTHVDLSLSFSINSLLTETDGGLLKRIDDKAGALAKLGGAISRLRRGNVDIARRRAEELVEEDQEEGKTVRLFVAETVLTHPSTLSEPRLRIEMSLGGQISAHENKSVHVGPSLEKEDSLALWDSLIKSFRIRPGSV